MYSGLVWVSPNAVVNAMWLCVEVSAKASYKDRWVEGKKKEELCIKKLELVMKVSGKILGLQIYVTFQISWSISEFFENA